MKGEWQDGVGGWGERVGVVGWGERVGVVGWGERVGVVGWVEWCISATAQAHCRLAVWHGPVGENWWPNPIHG